MHPTCNRFETNVAEALTDEQLKKALARTAVGLPSARERALEKMPEFEALRDDAVELKKHVLEHLDFYLERFEQKVIEQGGKVHWCATHQEAREVILKICQDAEAKTVTKGKSMIGEEIAINDYLETHGIEPVETDLGEYIIQIRKEPPSHIVGPAIHLNKEQVAESFRKTHTDLPADRPLDDPADMLKEARTLLRERFLKADVGITGANFLVAETGSTAIVTNEGNGDLTQILPRVHIAISSIEKVVPTLEDADTILRVLARSITGQELSVYTTFSTGSKRAEDLDGPDEFHVVLLDAGRSEMLGNEFKDMLRCIRCGACLCYCPVYTAIGGHAYGWVYSGPMGAVLTPSILGHETAAHLPNASTFCGRCEDVCPVRIPIPKMLRHWREREVEQGRATAISRIALEGWAFFAKRPALYHPIANLKYWALGFMGRKKGRFTTAPGAQGWTKHRDLPAPEGKTFQQLWLEKGGRR